MVTKVYHTGGLLLGYLEWVESYSNGYATVVVRTMGGYETHKVPYAAIEIELR